MSNRICPLARKSAPTSVFIDVDKLLAAYFSEHLDPTAQGQRVTFGTSGCHGSEFDVSFNEWHVLANVAGAVEAFIGADRAGKQPNAQRAPGH